jgi:hypothetical protein
MHENRETSSTPPAICEGRSVKANKTNDGRVRAGKVSLCRVTVNRPNKGGKPSALSDRRFAGAHKPRKNGRPWDAPIFVGDR